MLGPGPPQSPVPGSHVSARLPRPTLYRHRYLPFPVQVLSVASPFIRAIVDEGDCRRLPTHQVQHISFSRIVTGSSMFGWPTLTTNLTELHGLREQSRMLNNAVLPSTAKLPGDRCARMHSSEWAHGLEDIADSLATREAKCNPALQLLDFSWYRQRASLSTRPSRSCSRVVDPADYDLITDMA